MRGKSQEKIDREKKGRALETHKGMMGQMAREEEQKGEAAAEK